MNIALVTPRALLMIKRVIHSCDDDDDDVIHCVFQGAIFSVILGGETWFSYETSYVLIIYKISERLETFLGENNFLTCSGYSY